MSFKHGGDIESFALNIGCDMDEVIDLSSNINFVKPDTNIDLNTITLNSYPKYEKLYSSIANHFEVDSSNIELYNGGSSAIFALMNYFFNTNCYIYSPAYIEYKKSALSCNKNVELINRFVELKKDILPNSLVIFVNPSTPDGTLYDMEELLLFWQSKNATILIDESFLEFSMADSCTKYINKYEKLYILKSMTKFHSCAGVRIGCVISNKANIEALKQNEPLWKISQLDSLYMQSILKDERFRKISLAVNANSKAYLEQTIKEFSDFFDLVSPSNANFVLVRLKTMKANEFQDKLKPYKIMIRDCSNFDFLDDEYIRIAVKSQKDMEKFKEAVKNIVF